MLYSNIFDTEALQHFESRIQQLTPTTTPQWGKMNVAQMLAHCTVCLEQTMSQVKPAPRNLFAKIFGPMFKGTLTNDKPFKPGTPTSPHFITLGLDKNFKEEQEKLLSTLRAFSTGGEKMITPYEHPFFGLMTNAEWNKAQCKHLHHHLTQFGV